MNKTKIGWCDYTWNPVWGCRRGCPYCYARATAQRWKPGDNFEPRWMEKNFNRAMPKDPAIIFVNSMSDIEWWEPEWWNRVILRIAENPQHQFLFLTKNPEVYNGEVAPENCWVGVTATNPAEVLCAQSLDSGLIQFLSIEPIQERIDPVTIDLDVIDWVILGAETGHRPGRIVPPAAWVAPWLDLKIPLFMKDNLPWDGERRREFPR